MKKIFYTFLVILLLVLCLIFFLPKKEKKFLSKANNTEKYWRITYKKDVWQDRGYSISGESLEEYENLLTYSEIKDYIKRILETNNMK